MKKSAGILLPVASLPGGYGIGCFDSKAYEWIDFLQNAHQKYWQILPLGPTGYGDSPYQSFSTFAGNPYFISLDDFVVKGYLKKEELPAKEDNDKIDYEKIYKTRFPLLRKAFLRANLDEDPRYEAFCGGKFWLDDYALYMAIKDKNNGSAWYEWEDGLRLREKASILKAKEELKEDIEFYKFLQYEFFLQWTKLKSYANNKGIKIIGDIPIYVAYDSADAWANKEVFQFDENQKPIAVAGCPPDGFSADGQLWGNPLYNWDRLKEDNYKWWVQRVKACYDMYDVLRIDHFRGFDEYYAIPFGETTARCGSWQKGPGMDLFNAINKELGEAKIIAEDLGFLTDSVINLLKETNYPGMKVFQFAFDARDTNGSNNYLPHNYKKNCIAYTGTHDNETTLGWFSSITKEEKAMLCKYLDVDFNISDDDLLEKSIMTMLDSVAKICIIPMQDYLHLDNRARLNTPSTLGNNWTWRMQKKDINEKLEKHIASMTDIAGRSGVEIKLPSRKDLINLNPKDIYEKVLNIAFGTNLKEASLEELYYGLLIMVKELAKVRQKTVAKKRKLYYISAEFLIGKLLSNNLLNLGIFEDIAKALEEVGVSITKLEEFEMEPSLGNGGLGRLAACFLDSIATLDLPGDGVGLNYHLGLFKQEFKDRKQVAKINPWLKNFSWLNKTPRKFTICYKDFSLVSNMYDVDVIGYGKGLNKLHLFDVETVDEDIVNEGISFDLTKIKENLTLFLYPDDSTHEGKMLRLYQQYFMVSSAAQLILAEMKEQGRDLHRLYEYACVQINDTHPSMVIPELINQLVKEGIPLDEAVDIVSKTCAYTNHTILAEALEKWDLADIENIAPSLVPTIKYLDKIAKTRTENKALSIIDENNKVHMAHMDIHFGYSINGVAYLHTEILKNSELHGFYELYPEKFNNKTNGITFRRWLLACNKPLTNLLDKLIGTEYRNNAYYLEKLLNFYDDEDVLEKLSYIKAEEKVKFANFLYNTRGIEINPHSIFDVQVKRLHEYKRQQLNLLYICYMLNNIRKGNLPPVPITFIFGAKAAPAYVIAQDIIHGILCLRDVIEQDPIASKYIKIVMLDNYNVSLAEKVIPACDLSEQISLASKEASGTGNMKFMLNGAVTIGTEDGANVEIHELVGDDNIFIFGESSDKVIEHYNKGDYHSKSYYDNDEDIKNAVDFIISEEMLNLGDDESLKRLHNELVNKDWFMTLLDFNSYKETKNKAYHTYLDQSKWQKMCLVNIAKAGFFSSDRTIEQYNHDIWHLE